MEIGKSSLEEEKIDQQIRRKTIISLSVLLAGFTLDVIAWKWLRNQEKEQEQPRTLRRALDLNAKINSAFFNVKNLAREYTKSEADPNVRLNGYLGLNDHVDYLEWRLRVDKDDRNPKEKLHLKLEDITNFPKRELIFNFKCIEGWSQVSYWGGTRFMDFIKKYSLGTRSGNIPDPENRPDDLFKYVGLITPDKEYYVGIDMKSMIHPQTTLCYEMNGKPLPVEHGFPLRLIITVKYGIKNLKCIDRIYFTDVRPPDYWYERGYDYDVML